MLQGEILVFYLTFVLLIEAIYLPVLKSLVHIYEMLQINHPWHYKDLFVSLVHS